jgi:DNA-binding transcriptional LysR family regulator
VIEIAVDGRVLTNDAAFMVRAALDGLGLAYVVEQSVDEELRSGRLVRALEAYCSPFPGFFLYYPSRSQVPLKLKVLIDFLHERLSPAPKREATLNKRAAAPTKAKARPQRAQRR